MIKVIHVITDMKIGGAGKWLLNFLRNYDRDTINIKVIVPTGSILKTEINKLNIEVAEVDGIGDKSLDFSCVNAFLKLFKKDKPDIVHTHASLSARIAAKLSGVKAIVHTKHCIDAPKHGIKKGITAAVNNTLSNKTIAVSEAVGKNLEESGMPKAKISIIYGGVEELKILSWEEIKKIRASYGIDEKAIVFGMVARLAEIKGHKYLLQAAAQVLQKRNDIKFVIAGTGPMEGNLKKAVQDLGIQEDVIFTGFIEDVESIYNILDVNMITSTSEALCLSLIEGMTLGKPMIGTEVGGVPELIADGDTGLLVPAREPEALAEAILTLADNSELRKTMGMRARELMEQKFSASAMSANICRLYQEVLD